MEVAALQVGRETYQSLVRCDHPDTPQGDGTDESPTGITEEENLRAPTPAEVFAHLHRAFSLERATVVMWGSMAYRFCAYASEKRLDNPFSQTRVLDLQAATALFFDLKTASCKNPRNAMYSLYLSPAGESFTAGTLSTVHAMGILMQKLLASGWTPEATPDAIIDGNELSEVSEEMRIDRWEQIRERQSNLGIERRQMPDMPPAFIVLDCEHVSIRRERISRLIEVALVVAQHRGDATYALTDRPFSSLVQVLNVEDAWAKSWEMTGINPEDVRRAPPLPQVMTAMAAAAPWESGVLVTWGPDDTNVITQNCVAAGIPSPVTEVPLIDIQRAFSRFYGLELRQVRLQNAAEYLGIDLSSVDLHRALADTVVTWKIMERMISDGWTPAWRSWHRSDSTPLTAK